MIFRQLADAFTELFGRPAPSITHDPFDPFPAPSEQEIIVGHIRAKLAARERSRAMQDDISDIVAVFDSRLPA